MGYSYKGPEVIVGEFRACGIIAFHIEKMNLRTRNTASGTIKIIDYIENCGADHAWQARKEKDTWVVWCADEEKSWRLKKEDGHVAFTWVESINDDMKKFIAENLILFENLSVTT